VLIVGRGFGADNLHLRPTAGAFHDGKELCGRLGDEEMIRRPLSPHMTGSIG
jgi:hypothetical protein